MTLTPRIPLYTLAPVQWREEELARTHAETTSASAEAARLLDEAKATAAETEAGMAEFTAQREALEVQEREISKTRYI